MVTHTESFWVGKEARGSPSEAVLTEVPPDQLSRKKTLRITHFIWGSVVGGEDQVTLRLPQVLGFLPYPSFLPQYPQVLRVLPWFLQLLRVLSLRSVLRLHWVPRPRP